MPFKLVLGNVTNYEGDAILNSLGPNGKVYGSLCQAIITAANDPKIKNFVDGIVNAEATSIYLTPAGDLPCKNIIHVVTPYKKNDIDNKLLLKCYKKALAFAIEKGFNSICLPIIGSKACGYTSKESYDALIEACREIVVQEEKEDREIINIIGLKYLSDKKYHERINNLELALQNERNKKLLESDGDVIDISNNSAFPNMTIIEGNSFKYSGEQKLFAKMIKPFVGIDNDKLITFNFKSFMNDPKYDPKYPFYFLLYLMKKRGISESELAPDLSKDTKKNFMKTQQLQNKDVIHLASDAGLCKEDIIAFLVYNGSSLSPRSVIDRAIAKYLNNYDNIEYKNAVDYIESYTGIDLYYDSLSPIDKQLNCAWISKEERHNLLLDKERERRNTSYK